MTRILVTTTSFQDTPGEHHDLLQAEGYEVVGERGPLSEERMLELVGDLDGLLCGDDAITSAVIEKALPRLKVIAKYGIGIDKIDVDHATSRGLPVTFCPGVNHTTVAEHTFALLLAVVRNLIQEVDITRAGDWQRITGTEIMGKTIAIAGLGRIGKEVAVRAKAFGMKVKAFDLYWDEEFAKAHEVIRCESLEEVFSEADFISLHVNLTDETRNMLNQESITKLKDGAVVLNCARGELVDSEAMVAALQSGKLGGYGADVLDLEPPPKDHPLLNAPNTVITPHIGSRTYESVQRQAGMATRNLINVMKGEKPLAQVNDVPILSPDA
jgi:D-3-phosphoglycerate dehydrogenase / 2-oxoglutarate reductase